MTAIHLTAAEADRVRAATGDLVVLIVEGDWVPSDPTCEGQCGLPHDRSATVPPARWVEHDKPCETCRGRGVLVGNETDQPEGRWLKSGSRTAPHPTAADVWGADCPACDGSGRKVVTLTADCPKWCERYGDGLPPDEPGCSIGNVTLCRATVQVVPVVDASTAHIDCPPDYVVTGWTSGTRHGLILGGGDRTSMLPLPTPPRPGIDWAVIVRPVET